MVELLHRPGFLGTNANFAADMTLTFSILVAILFTVGALLARRGHYKAHRWVQTSGAVLNIVLVLWLMVLPYRDFVLVDLQQPTRPAYFYQITTLHAAIGFFAFTFGNFVVLRGNGLVPRQLRFQNYKPYMRTAYLLYMAATLLGFWVYLTWFISIENPPLF